MKTTLITALILTITSCSSTNSGWGPHQSSGTAKGALGGAAIGGVLGHQTGKRDEGILIGALLGSVVGNNIGKNQDYRNRDHQLEDERARAAQLEYQLNRARELQSLRDRQNKALIELEQLNK